MTSAPNQGPQLQAVSIVFLALSWVSVSLRCYVRAVLMKSFGSDDWLILASLGAFTLFATFGFLCTINGGGQHIADLSLDRLSISLKWWWLAEIFYAVATSLLKFSIGAFLLKLSGKRSHRCTVWAVMIIVILVTIISVCLIIFQCNPISYFWLRFQIQGKCLSSVIALNMTWAHTVINCCADWTLAILPVFMVWNLDMNPRTKISLAIILSLGGIGSAATIVRCIYVEGITKPDFLWDTVGISIWSTVEVGIGITAVSLATLKPLFVHFLSRQHLCGSDSTTPFSDSAPSKMNRSASSSTTRYLRSSQPISELSGTSGQDTEAIELRDDIGKGHGVTTVIGSEGVWKSPIEEETGIIYNVPVDPVHKSMTRQMSERALNSTRKTFCVGRSRSQSQTRLNEEEDGEISPSWESGIRKTMVITTNSEEEGQRPGTALSNIEEGQRLGTAL